MGTSDIETDRAQLVRILNDVIDELNAEEFFRNPPLSKDPDTPIFGGDGRLDSLELVNLVMAIEERIEDVLERSISLADDRAMSQERSPFRTVQSLIDYMTLLLNESPR